MKRILVLLLLFTYLHGITLNTEKTYYTKQKHLRCVSTGSWAPLNFIQDHKLLGMGIDYWNLVTHRLALDSQCTTLSQWTDVLTALKENKADLTLATKATEENKAFAVYTDPYITYPIVIVTQNNIGFIDNIRLLKNKVIAIGRNYTVSDIIKKHYPQLNVQYTDSVSDALRLVDEGKAFAVIDILPVLSYKLNKEAFHNLKISGSIPYDFPVSFMLRKELKPLISPINKAISTISEKERNKISSQWLSIHRTKTIPVRYLYYMIIIILFTILLVWWWTKKLHNEVVKSKENAKDLQQLILIDKLTSIGNRYMIEKTLSKSISFAKRYHTPLSIIFFDINKFKSINDIYGHKTGDMILKELAELIQSNIRSSDMLCRWGGDEFIITLPFSTYNDAEKVACILTKQTQEHHFYKDLSVSFTYGIAEYKKGDTLDFLIHKADIEFYKAKKRTLL